MSKTIKINIDDKTHARLIKKADKEGVKRSRLYERIIEEGSKK